jgi:ferrous-iron efflux pump FieF
MVVQQLHQVVHPLMDGALPAGELARLREVLESHPDVKGYHNVLSRSTGRERMVQMHVLLDDDLTFVEAHDLAERIESEVSSALGGAVVTIHYEPYLAETCHRREHHPAG